MQLVRFQELIDLYGASLAHEMLLVLEKAGRLPDNVTPLNASERLERALEALRDVHYVSEVKA